jgi:hypothetical protein
MGGGPWINPDTIRVGPISPEQRNQSTLILRGLSPSIDGRPRSNPAGVVRSCLGR